MTEAAADQGAQQAQPPAHLPYSLPVQRDASWFVPKRMPWELYGSVDNPHIAHKKITLSDGKTAQQEWRAWVDVCPEYERQEGAAEDDECPGYLLDHYGPGGEWFKKRECPIHGYRWMDREATQTFEEYEADLLARLNAANIPHMFQTYTIYSYPRKDSGAHVACLQYAAQGKLTHSLLIKGEFGVGKTGLAVGILKDRITARGERGFFCVVPELFADIRASFNNNNQSGGAGLSTLMSRVLNVHLLVLDDLGAERATEWVQEQLYVIINTRLINGRPTIVTTNLNMEELIDQLGPRTVERLKSYRRITVAGQNLRNRTRPPVQAQGN